MHFLSVSIIAGAAIGYELLLMRLMSIVQWHHFAYMIISLALLGFGASGSFLVLTKQWFLQRLEYSLWFIALCFSIASILVFFDSKNPLKKDDLNRFDMVLSFLNGDTFLEHYFDLLSTSGICVACGSTGFEWKPEMLDKIKAGGGTWIKATNFSLGMNLVKEMIKIASKANSLFSEEQLNFHINDIHHTKKLDAPSGTALLMERMVRS